MDPDSMMLLAVVVLMVVMSGYFSATETAFTSLNRIRLKSRAENGDKKAEKTLEQKSLGQPASSAVNTGSKYRFAPCHIGGHPPEKPGRKRRQKGGKDAGAGGGL